jgi:hypothetical protein
VLGVRQLLAELRDGCQYLNSRMPHFTYPR